MRCYFFGNFYLSSIQQGIQALHAVSEMFVKYHPDDTFGPQPFKKERGDTLMDWARYHKTVVLLNGGDADSLMGIKGFLSRIDNPYPHDFFEESVGALNQCLTSVGIVLSERMYDKESTLVGRELNKAVFAGETVTDVINKLLSSLQKGLIPATLQPIDQIQNERKYTAWELEFLALRVQCDLAK
jgi:hypothetical protein